MKKTVAFQKNARNVFFHILTRCNLRCKHCYINPKAHGTQTLDRVTVEQWLEILAHPHKETNLIFIGGEPTLHTDLSPLIETARAIGYASVTVDTNGFFFNGILDRIGPDAVDYFSVGLDGSSREVNDRIRGEGSYDACISGVEQALAKGFNVSVIYTVSRWNIDDLKSMPHLLKAIGVDRFFIQVVGIRGRLANQPSENGQVTRKEWATTVPRLAERSARMGIHTTYPKVFLDREDEFECAGMVAENYFVFPNGRVYQCPLCEDFPIHSLSVENGLLEPTPPINETDLFQLTIPEGCVMNRLIQPGNIDYDRNGQPKYKIACCLLKEEVTPQ